MGLQGVCPDGLVVKQPLVTVRGVPPPLYTKAVAILDPKTTIDYKNHECCRFLIAKPYIESIGKLQKRWFG